MSPEDGTITADRLWKRFRPDAEMAAGARLRHLLGRSSADRRRNWRWALRDLSLHVDAGESVGVVGVNGSGKSTLLKILTGTMDPTAGRVTVRGRVGALIELQAGLHPELTGRENVVAYGNLMGLSRREADRRLETVIEFAGVADAADRQVKFYSTGMRLRLGFAIAAHLDAAVLLVDEVLAVADADFQRLCLDRIGALNREGATVAVVSHDLRVIEAVCDRVVWIDGGTVAADGGTVPTLAAYRAARHRPAPVPGPESVPVDVRRVTGGDDDPVASGGAAVVELVVRCPTPVRGVLRLGVGLAEGEPLLVLEREEALPAGRTAVTCRLDSLPLAGGSYRLWAGFGQDGREPATWRPRTEFEVHGPRPRPSGLPVAVAASWEFDSA